MPADSPPVPVPAPAVAVAVVLCLTCSRYSCRCNQADDPWTRLAPWTQAFTANA